MTDSYSVIQKAIDYLEEHFVEQPELQDVARFVGLSEFHFQRLFRRRVGVSPKRFLQYLTAHFAKELLRSHRSVLDAAYESGLSGPGRLHDLMVAVNAATPGEIKQRGAGLTIRYGIHESPFGDCLIAVTDRGICALYLVEPRDTRSRLEKLREEWSGAAFLENPQRTKFYAERAFRLAKGDASPPFTLHLAGTNFQLKVWEALLRIPMGYVASFEDVATTLGVPAGVGAVAAAVAKNPVSLLIPCHRVIHKSGAVGGDRYGVATRRTLLAWEAALVSERFAGAAC